MTERFEAQVRVRGDAQAREAFRRRANAQLAAEFPDVRYRELHDRDQLDWRLACAGGVPFPPFVEASVAHPELDCVVEWRESEGAPSRRARVAGGQLAWEEADGSTAAGAGASAVHVAAGRDGELRHAVAIERVPDASAWLGYLATAERHAFFLCEPGRSEVAFSDGLDPEWAWRASVADHRAEAAPLAAPDAMGDAMAERLHDIAERFAADWLWFDAAPEPETAIERHRFAQYGFPVRPANLQSRKLKRVLVEDATGYRLEPQEPAAAAAAALVLDAWEALQRS